MKKVQVTITVPASSTSTAVDVSALTGLWFQFEGVTAAGATVVIEGTNDQSSPTYVALTSSITADGFVEIPHNCWQVRVNRTVAGAGAVTCVGYGWSEQS